MRDRYTVTETDIRQGVIRQMLRRSREGLRRSQIPPELQVTVAYLIRRGEVVRCNPGRGWSVYKLAYRVDKVEVHQ